MENNTFLKTCLFSAFGAQKIDKTYSPFSEFQEYLVYKLDIGMKLAHCFSVWFQLESSLKLDGNINPNLKIRKAVL